MISQPDKLPEWATDDGIDDGPDGQHNWIEPPASKKRTGWSYLEFPVRNWFNWLQRTTWQWLAYFKAEHDKRIIVSGGSGPGVSSPDSTHLQITVPLAHQLLTLHAVDESDAANYLVAVGNSGTLGAPIEMNVVAGEAFSFSPYGDNGAILLAYGPGFSHVTVVVEQMGAGN